jgi:hypothetical protein
MPQREASPSWARRNGHFTGRRQHLPQRRHWPRLEDATGMAEVTSRNTLANIVFLWINRHPSREASPFRPPAV